MKIVNHTAWDARTLRALMLRCETWLGLKGKWCRSVTFVYSRGCYTTGYAYYNGGSVRIRLPNPYPRNRPAPFLPHTPRVNDQGEARPSIFAEAAWVIEHEMLHVKGMRHDEMRRTRHPAYKCREAEPPPWAVGAVLRVAESVTVTARPKTPEVKAEARAARTRDRAERDAQALARWTRKLKLATTKVRNLRRRIAARERRTNSEVIA
jgi:hypothetical protein